MAERPALDAIVFDAGGTLVRLDFEWIGEMLRELGVVTSFADLRRSEASARRAYDAAAAGAPVADGAPPSTRPSNAYLRELLAGVGVRGELLDDALARLWARQLREHFLWAQPVEGARAMLDALPALGVRVCCVSNADGRAESILEHCGVRAGLEFVVDSHVEGIEKPDPALFQVALERLGVSAARALYVGDIRSVDEAGAHAAGMPFVLIDPFGDYAAPGTHAIASIHELPAFVERTFATPAARGNPGP